MEDSLVVDIQNREALGTCEANVQKHLEAANTYWRENEAIKDDSVGDQALQLMESSLKIRTKVLRLVLLPEGEERSRELQEVTYGTKHVVVMKADMVPCIPGLKEKLRGLEATGMTPEAQDHFNAELETIKKIFVHVVMALAHCQQSRKKKAAKAVIPNVMHSSDFRK